MKLKPYFRKPMRYHSSVDSMAHPQIFIVNEGVAVCPAYVISFVKLEPEPPKAETKKGGAKKRTPKAS